MTVKPEGEKRAGRMKGSPCRDAQNDTFLWEGLLPSDCPLLNHTGNVLVSEA